MSVVHRGREVGCDERLAITILSELRAGETIEITKRKRVIGRLMPPAPEKKAQLPDFMARLRRIYGNRVLQTTNA